MHSFIALLRGINVSGQKLIKMAELRASLTKQGLQDVETYIQSGNIVFNTEANSAEDLAIRIHEIILHDFGFDVSVQVLHQQELSQIIENNPFSKAADNEPNRVFALMLNEKPEQGRINQLLGYSTDQDQMVFTAGFLYLYCSQGAGKSKLSTNFIESKLKVSATSRNWNTLLKLNKMIESRKS